MITPCDCSSLSGEVFQYMEAYLGQLLLVPYNFAPVGWMGCEGQTLPISAYDALFALIGTTYGGDGQTNFKLPDLRGRTPVGAGTAATGTPYPFGQPGGCETVAIGAQGLAAHTHPVRVAGAAATSHSPGGLLCGDGPTMYSSAAPNASMAATACSTVGGGAAHENVGPYLPLRWIIAVEGIFPPRP